MLQKSPVFESTQEQAKQLFTSFGSMKKSIGGEGRERGGRGVGYFLENKNFGGSLLPLIECYNSRNKWNTIVDKSKITINLLKIILFTISHLIMRIPQ